jgi:mannose-1-phosphate guanylyltransferase
MAKASNHYVLILCGGSGPRLWPLSRVSHPKQFLKLFGNQSLIQETYSRYQKIVPTSHIFVVSNIKYKSEIIRHLPSLPKTNLIIEPEKKNTAMAIVYGCSVIYKINSQAIVTTAPADHFISNDSAFSKDLSSAITIASINDTIVTIGVKPTDPNPAFGYILPSSKTGNFYPITKFIEKPTITDAQIYIKKDAYWNSGIYTFSIPTLLQELKNTHLTYYSLFQELIDHPKSITKVFKKSENLSFDVAISEKSPHLSMIICHFQWSDVGQWLAIYLQLLKKNSFATINQDTQFIQLNSKNCLLSGLPHKLIGLVGVNNLAVIDTPDSLLICDLNDSFSVRELVGQIVTNPKLKNFFLKSL